MNQFAVRLSQTPVRALPSWDESKGALVNPGFLEKLWYAAYLQFGAVADLNQWLLQTSGDKATPTSAPMAQGSQRKVKSGPLPPNPYTKKVKSRDPKDLKRHHTTWLLVKGSETPNFNGFANHSQAAQPYFTFINSLLQAVSRDCIILPNPNARQIYQYHPLTPATAPEDLPQDKYGVMTYCEGIYFAQTGQEQQFRMEISHDESVQRLLHRLSQVEAEFQFSLHPHQTFK